MPQTKAKKTPAPKAKPTTKPVRQRSPHKPGPYLPSFHDMTCDAVSDLLTAGGHDQDVTDLIQLSIRHLERRSFGTGWRQMEGDELTTRLQRALEHGVPKWKKSLEAVWKQREEKPEQAVAPKTITDRIRSNVRKNVEDALTTFLDSAGPEEMRFMNAVLEDRNQDNSIYDPAWPEQHIPIATWFEYHALNPSFDNKPNYIRVPETLVEKVDKYVQALIAVEGVVE